MHLMTAYAQRETLSTKALERLRAGLQDEATRYQESIKAYSAEKMAEFGRPYLAELQGRVSEVERVQASRADPA
jgi:hypothetical protein